MHDNILMRWLLSDLATMPAWRRRPAACALEECVYRKGRVNPAFAISAYLHKEIPMDRSGRVGRDYVLIVTTVAMIATTLAVLAILVVRWLND
jgi:hypothetical protein